MKAAILVDLNQIAVKEVSDPVCGECEMVIRPESVAICGSDVRIYRFGNDRVFPPTVIGHEIAGTIIEVGNKVTNFKVGQRVVLGADVPDMDTGRNYTLKGQGNLCPENLAIGYQLDGAFQQKMKLNENTVKYGPIVEIPDHVSFDEAALAEPLACAIHGFEMARMSIGKSICIIGLGPLGCMMVELTKSYGAGKIFAAQRSEKRLDMARKFLSAVDATFISTEEEDLVERVMKETNGEGVDVVITAAGTVKAQEDAIRIVKKRGVVNLFAGLKNQPKLEIDTNLIHYKECTVLGSHGSNQPDVEKAMTLIAKGDIKTKKYISRYFPLDDIVEAIEYHESRNGMKVIIKPQQ
ncbi:MAG: zinc-binding dehydrogenase [Prolixibacteraceae bacterium]|jgi:L-iditol 2-dehydrogenase|nr:zinc-binding dehydrogenase [Prolixibacteraceae bacterium]